MKRTTKMIFLLLLLVGLLAVYFAVNQSQPEVGPSGNNLLFAIDPDEITTIEISYNGEVNRLVRDNKLWFLRDDLSVPVNQELMNHLAFKLSRINVFKAVEFGESLSTYGLAPCICSVSFEEASAHILSIGATTPMDSMRYVSVGGEKLYMVDETILSEFALTAEDICG